VAMMAGRGANLLRRGPESLRGPQFDAAWCDELAKWCYAEATFDSLHVGTMIPAGTTDRASRGASIALQHYSTAFDCFGST
jgi:phage terminase large subunit-like protein